MNLWYVSWYPHNTIHYEINILLYSFYNIHNIITSLKLARDSYCDGAKIPLFFTVSSLCLTMCSMYVSLRIVLNIHMSQLNKSPSSIPRTKKLIIIKSTGNNIWSKSPRGKYIIVWKDQKQTMMGIVRNRNRYSLVWKKKPPKTAHFKFLPKKEIEKNTYTSK